MNAHGKGVGFRSSMSAFWRIWASIVFGSGKRFASPSGVELKPSLRGAHLRRIQGSSRR
jgi:hypothetical protein